MDGRNRESRASANPYSIQSKLLLLYLATSLVWCVPCCIYQRKRFVAVQLDASLHVHFHVSIPEIFILLGRRLSTNVVIGRKVISFLQNITKKS